jgi:hypothetical protein
MKAIKAPWQVSVGIVKREHLISPMELEYREMSLNQRLIDKYYDRIGAELAEQIVEFQRNHRPESRERLA